MTDVLPAAKGRGFAIASLVLASVGILAALLILLIFGGYALMCLVTGAPMHVLASVAHFGAIAAVIAVPPLSAPGLVFGVIALVRSRGSAVPVGTRSRRPARALAIVGIVLSVIGLLSVLLGIPFWDVEVCMTVVC